MEGVLTKEQAEGMEALGQWILVELEPPPKKSKGGLFLPDGNLFERIGYTVAKVVSAGPGYFQEQQNGKIEFTSFADIKPGDRAVFRGYLGDAPATNFGTFCFMNGTEFLGILEGDAELDLCVPHDN
jgi:co-chaperonin GroES (HSP10)